jgi:predicted metal-binding membrane protein
MPPPVAAVSARTTRALIAGVLLLLAMLAWYWLLPMHMAPRGLAPGAAPVSYGVGWTAGHAWLLFLMWSVMMAGMMIPSAVPMVIALARVACAMPVPRPVTVASVFTLGYVLIWTGFSAAATGGQWLAEQTGLMSDMMASADPRFSGLLLIGAGLFQFTPLKHACLRHCRSPLGFLLTAWRPGLRATFFTGLRHGCTCLGCCWALMALLFVFGTMNLIAASALTALVLVEKMLPGGPLVARLAGAALTGWGLWAVGIGLAWNEWH